MHLKELHLSGKENMRRNAVDNPALESYLLLSKINAIENITDIYTQPQKDLGKETVEQYFDLIGRRINNEPTAYILGYKEFFSRRFKVNASVLIPRPETELLTEEALRTINTIESPTVLDLGCGSGCIAVTISAENSGAKVVAADISEKALETARDNANELLSANRISFLNGDLLSAFNKDTFDVLVSNPPYIAEGEYESLDPQVREYEPSTSLLGGKDGLSIISEIIGESPNILKNGGWCLLEIGAGQASRVKELFYDRGFRNICIYRDITNIERVIKAQWKK